MSEALHQHTALKKVLYGLSYSAIEKLIYLKVIAIIDGVLQQKEKIDLNTLIECKSYRPFLFIGDYFIGDYRIHRIKAEGSQILEILDKIEKMFLVDLSEEKERQEIKVDSVIIPVRARLLGAI